VIAFVKIEEYLSRWKEMPAIDVRSPSEFVQGHIPGAFNRPLFNDEERTLVGTRYARSGRMASVMLGMDLTSGKFSGYIREIYHRCGENPFLVHCWRGGMRSAAMAMLMDLAGMRPVVLEGGYKSFRNFVLRSFERNTPMIVLGGRTGTGKTIILKELMKLGEQVIDLEHIARHKGSAFGSLGMPPQQTNEQFENDLFKEWYHIDTSRHVWLEDESLSVGTNAIPRPIFLTMGQSPMIVIDMPKDLRIKRLVMEYTGFGLGELENSILRIQRRLGGENTAKAIQAIMKGNMADAANILLTYYDKAYELSIGKRSEEDRICRVRVDTDDPFSNALLVLQSAKGLILN
jgi:tRNA 2-selenouridine synthase